MRKKNSSGDVMRLPAQAAQDARGLGAVSRFSDNLAIERDQSVRGENDALRPAASDAESFAERVPGGSFAESKVIGKNFVDFGSDDFELEAGVG